MKFKNQKSVFANDVMTLAACCLLVGFSLSALAQPLTLSGFNASVIVPATGTSSQPDATAFDTVDDYAFYEAGLPGSSRGLPATGQFTSSWDGQTVFQFGDYGANDALMLGNNYTNSGTLTLVTPQSIHSLAVLASSADYSGQATVGTMVINFTNGTHSQPFDFNAPNWFSSYSHVALAGVGRINLGSFSSEDNGNAAPILYQTTIPLAALGFTQAVASITFTMPPQATNTAIFAVSQTTADPPVITQQPSPASELLFTGGSLSLSASAAGSSPLSYFWEFNDVPITGATNADYAIPNVQSADSGDYSLMVSNAFGMVTSATVTITVMPIAPFPVNMLASHPLAYWRLDESNGTTAIDYAGTNNGIYTNVILGQPGYGSTPPVQSDPTELAAQFGPTNSYVSIPTIDLSVTNGGDGEFAIAAWVNADTNVSVGAGIVAKGYGGGDEQFALDCGGPGNAFRFFVHDAVGNVYPIASSVVPDNHWHWLVGVCDEANSNMTLYVDGTNAAQGTITAGSGIHASAVPASIGAREGGLDQPYNLQFLGRINDVAIFTNALDAAQIASMYQAATDIGITQEPPTVWRVAVSGSVTNQVTASGSGLTYQWFGPDGVIPGATNAILALANVQPAQAGIYFVMVSNSFGSVQSTASLLRVLPATMYFQDFSAIAAGATNVGDGSQLFSTAPGSVGEVEGYAAALTADGAPNVSSAFLLPDLNPGVAIQAFSAKWNSEIYGNFPNAGDGFSFNFGHLAGLNLTNGPIESGYGTGLCFSVQTSVTDNPGIYLRINGSVIASVTNNPTAQWGNYNSTRHYWEVDWNVRDGLTARLDGTLIFYHVPTSGFAPQVGDRFAWGARCGAATEETRLANIVVVTGGNLVPVLAMAPYYQAPGTSSDFSANNAFDGNTGSSWISSSPSEVGATVVPAAQVLVYSITSVGSYDGNGGNGVYLPIRWTFDGSSNSGANWTNIADASGNFNNAAETRAWVANNFNSFSAYRLNMESDSIYHPVGVSDVRFYRLQPFTTNSAAVTTTNFNIISPSDPIAATSTNSPFLQGAAEAIDGTASGEYLNSDITNMGFTVYPARANIPVQALSLISADSPENDPASFALYGSPDGTNFTLIASNSVPPFPTINSIQSFNFANTNTYAAYKVIFPTVQNPATANSVQVAEVELLPYGDITSPQDALRLQVPSGASLNGIGPAGSLLDRAVGGDANKIVVLNDTANVVAIITPAVGASIVKGVELIGGDDDSQFPDREPSSFTLEGSNDGVTFTNVLSVNLLKPTANMQIQGFPVLENTNVYKIYRATFGPPQWGNVLQLGELRLFGSRSGAAAVSTAPASPVTAASANLNGLVNPNSFATVAWFEWGLTTNYGNVTASQNAGTIVPVNATITGLSAGTTYHCQLVASNSFGTSFGGDVVFTTERPNSPYAAEALALHPLAYWRLNETSGTTAYDFAGMNNGTYTNVILGQPGYGSAAPAQSAPTELAALFGPTNGAQSYVSIPTIDLGVTNGGNGEFAITAWVNASNTISDGAGIIAKGYGGADEQFVLDCGGPGNAFRFFVRDAAGNTHVAASSVLPDNQWHWLMGVCDEANSNVTLYVDGTNAAEGAITPGTGIHASAVPVSIGAREGGLDQPYNLQFLGKINDVAIFTNALDAAQIASMYQAATAIGIQEEPTAIVTAVLSSSVTNQVTASGSDLTYQWFGPDGAITDATNAMLVLTNVQATQAGTYYVTVSNSFGTVQSTAWLLRVVPVGVYFQDFSSVSVGATNFGDGSQLFSTALGSSSGAEVQDDTHKELSLTAAGDGDVTSAFESPDLDPGTPVYAFSVKWNSQVYGGFPNAGNGFSFNFGQLASLNLTNGAVESGYSTGLCFSVQTSVTNNPGFYLRVNGNTLASVTNNPSTQWGNYNSTRHFWEVDWNYTNGLTARLDGQIIFSNAPTYGFIPHAGDVFVWAARCNGSGEEVRLDNIVAMPGGNLVQVPVTQPYYADANVSSSYPASNAFDGDNSSYWSDNATTGFAGATVSSANPIRVYSLTSASNEDRSSDAKTWALEGSNDGGTSWSNCAANSGAFVNAMETRCWMATNAADFGAYRLNILQNNGNSLTTTLGELRLYQFKPVAFPAFAWVKTMTNQPPISSVMGQRLASSSDGTKWAAAIEGVGIFVSTDSGLTWTKTSAPAESWDSIASSADGNKLAATANSGGIWTSTDAGAHWTKTSASSDHYYWSVASSADGNQLTAVTIGWIIVSTDAGTNWETVNTESYYWNLIASSADGKKLATTEFNEGWILSSIDSGTTWMRSTAPLANYYSLAMSADGSTLAGGCIGLINLSTNSGDTWIRADVPSESWLSIAISSDGSKLAAAAREGGIYTSTDHGVTWTPANAPGLSWCCIASSADGNKLVAMANGGGIWTYAALSTPLPPAATTASADQIDLFHATLNGQVNPNFLQTTAWFEWGFTTNYGNTTPPQNFGTDLNNFNATITGLSSGTTYHYRIVALNNYGTNYGADMTFTTLSDNYFFDIVSSGDTVVPTSANSPAGQEAGEAIDGTAADKYLNFDKLNTGFTIFPLITNVPIRAIGLISAEDSPERDPASFALYGSPDGTNFTFIASNSVPPFIARNAIQSFAFTNTNAYAAYKIIFPTVQNPAAANSMQIAEVELLPYGDITSPNDVLSLSLPAGASLNGVGPANSLLDRQIGGDANKIVVLNDAANVVALVTPAVGASILKGVELIGGNDDATYPGREPSSLTLEGSNDGVTFTNLLSANPAAPTANMQIQGFSVPGNTNAYKIYRVTFGPPQSGNVLQIGELRLFGIKFGAAGVITTPANPVNLDGANLNGQVNPNSSATTAWFEWGLTTNYGNVTPTQDVGGGNAVVPVAAIITSLSSSTMYHYQLVASNSFGASFGGDETFTTGIPVIPWTAQNGGIANGGNQNWHFVASSSDGTKLVAVAVGGQIYTSTDSGVTWTARESNRNWYSVASSADGTKLVAVVNGGYIYTSTDSGATWTAQTNGIANGGIQDWFSVASSADGSKLVAVIDGGQIYISSDSGMNWTARESSRGWWSVASSADGSKLVAVDRGGQIYTSSDSGTNWTAQANGIANGGIQNWYSVASSADGTKLVAVVFGGQIYTSTDSGANWTARMTDSNRNWESVACSADGTKLVAAVYHGQIYTSTDSGVNWTVQTNGIANGDNQNWTSAASSSDGTKLVTVDYGGQIYTWRLPSLSLALSANNLAILWTTNQTGLVLQQTTNLAAPDWKAVPPDSIVVTNNQYQILISPSAGNQFFRLGAQ